MLNENLRIFFGIFLTIWGLSAILNRHHLAQVLKDASLHPSIQLILGLISLILGAFVVSVHNIWSESHHEIGITILGWLILIAGAFKVLFVKQFVKILKGIQGTFIFLSAGIIATVFGIALLLA